MSPSRTLLRIGIGITFVWIGSLIFRDPSGWATLISPWATAYIPGSLAMAMQETAVLDIVIGALLIIGVWTWLAALLGMLHLIVVLVTTGLMTDFAPRDFGLLCALSAIFIDSSLPKFMRRS